MRLRRALALGAATVATVTGVLTGPVTAQAETQPRHPKPAVTTLANTIALSNCSASLVRFPTSSRHDQALMLTNGHCYEGGFLDAGEVLINQASGRTGALLDATGASLGTVTADRILYATMTGTDVTLYRLTATFAALRRDFGAVPRTISAAPPRAGTVIDIPSGYWREIWNCSVDRSVDELREDEWTWHDSIRYDAACDTIHGTSGSPLVDAGTGQVVGINNTGNDHGAMCTLNNPCEVNEDGTTSAYLGQSYGQQTYWLTTCVTRARTIDLARPGCLLTKPAT